MWQVGDVCQLGNETIVCCVGSGAADPILDGGNPEFLFSPQWKGASRFGSFRDGPTESFGLIISLPMRQEWENYQS